jgi:hypothetical protein
MIAQTSLISQAKAFAARVVFVEPGQRISAQVRYRYADELRQGVFKRSFLTTSFPCDAG